MTGDADERRETHPQAIAGVVARRVLVRALPSLKSHSCARRSAGVVALGVIPPESERRMPGRWANSRRRDELPPDWKQRRARVLARDGYRCTKVVAGERCQARATDVDHVQPGADHRESNLTSLCTKHHLEKSSAEGVAARPKRRRAPEPHPGILREG